MFLVSDSRFHSDGRVGIRKKIKMVVFEHQQLIMLPVVNYGAAEGVKFVGSRRQPHTRKASHLTKVTCAR